MCSLLRSQQLQRTLNQKSSQLTDVAVQSRCLRHKPPPPPPPTCTRLQYFLSEQSSIYSNRDSQSRVTSNRMTPATHCWRESSSIRQCHGHLKVQWGTLQGSGWNNFAALGGDGGQSDKCSNYSKRSLCWSALSFIWLLSRHVWYLFPCPS